jgi:hypothetical protein
MQAIVTKILPATNTKPMRVKAFCSRGSIILSRSEIENCFLEDVHKAACQALVDKFAKEDSKRIPVKENAWLRPKATGQLPDNAFAHVFI